MSVLLMRCGCVRAFDHSAVPPKEFICATHGPTGVSRVVGVPPPRIRGVAKGPHVETCDLAAHVGVLDGLVPMPAGKGPSHG